MDQSSNLFSYCVGGFALFSTLVSIAMFSRGYLPTAQMKILTEILDETKSIYDKAEAEQLLPDEQFRRAVKKKLTTLEGAASTLRVMTYETMSLQEEYMAAITGLTQNIVQLSLKVKKLRAFLLSASEEGKRRQERLRSQERRRSTSRDDSQRITNAPNTLPPNTSAPGTTIEAEVTSAVSMNNAQPELAPATNTNDNVNVGQAVGEMHTSPSELAALIKQLDSLDEPLASSPSRCWSLWGGESPPEEASPSCNVATTTGDRRPPSFSESTLSSSPTLLDGKLRHWSPFTRWINARSLAPKSGSDAPLETGRISPLHSWSLFGWRKNRPSHHQVRAASPDVGSLPV